MKPLCSAALLLVTSFLAFPARAADSRTSGPADAFLEMYNRVYQRLYTVVAEANWAALTDVTEEHTGRRIGAEQVMAAFVGSDYVIEQTKALLARTNELDAVAVRQLRMIYLHAAEAPATIPEVVNARIAAEARQSATLDGFEFRWRPPGESEARPITANQIDELLSTSTNLAERLAVWRASKASGVALKPGLLELRDLRNRIAREMGFSSFFALRAARFGMTVEELMAMNEELVRQTRPLYEQLHAWARQRLAERYGQPVPRLIPAHWLNNRWGQEWPGLAPGVDLDPLFNDRSPRWIVEAAVRYGESLGLPYVPETFWERSDLYELPAEARRKKNTHASAWDMNLDRDVRSLMNVRADASWFETAHHELGHIFYDLSYANREVPFVLRTGASPAFHEAIAETLATPTVQLPYLRQLGLVGADQSFDETQWLLNAALNQVVFIPWAAGVMPAWERDFYDRDLPADQLNERWWHYVEKYQGIAPPEPRGEEFCDAATKTHINDDPAEYHKYAMAFAIKYQLHQHIARKLLRQDPRQSSFYGRKEVGAFLYQLMRVGATRDWRDLIREATGEELSGQALLDYYEPLRKWLAEQNDGQTIGW